MFAATRNSPSTHRVKVLDTDIVTRQHQNVCLFVETVIVCAGITHLL